jgi:hypothetical protein
MVKIDGILDAEIGSVNVKTSRNYLTAMMKGVHDMKLAISSTGKDLKVLKGQDFDIIIAAYWVRIT